MLSNISLADVMENERAFNLEWKPGRISESGLKMAVLWGQKKSLNVLIEWSSRELFLIILSCTGYLII